MSSGLFAGKSHTKRPPVTFAAAREGWGGVRPVTQTHPNLLEQYGPEGTARAARASLIEAARPDLRIFLAIGALILLLRLLRSREEARAKQQTTSGVASGNQSDTRHAAQKAEAA